MHETGMPAHRRPEEGLTRAERARTTARLLTLAHNTADDVRRAALLDEVVLVNRPVARAIAARYRGRGVTTEDLEQTAYEGLVKAVRRFDPSIRSDLLTYAVPTIRGEITRYFRDHGWMVRPPRRIQEMQWQIGRSTELLSGRLGRSPSTQELCADIGCEESAVNEALAAFGSFHPISLEGPLPEFPELTWADTLLTDDTDATAVADMRAALGAAVRTLEARDRRILFLRFFEDRSQTEIGTVLGVTQMQVSRLLARILRDLRAELAA
jgi:RNA polymerase sigma-B factor